MGTIVLGKLESGVVYKGQVLTLMPNKVWLYVLCFLFVMNSLEYGVILISCDWILRLAPPIFWEMGKLP